MLPVFSAPLFPVALNLHERTCVVFSAPHHAEARTKAAALTACGARVAFFTREAAEAVDLRDAFLVLSTIKDAAFSQTLLERSHRHGFLLWCIDQPAYCSVSMMSVAAAESVQVAVSTSGAAPALSKALREAFQTAFDRDFEGFARALAELRRGVRRRMPGSANAAARVAIVRKAMEGFRASMTFEYPPWYAPSQEPPGDRAPAGRTPP